MIPLQGFDIWDGCRSLLRGNQNETAGDTAGWHSVALKAMRSDATMRLKNQGISAVVITLFLSRTSVYLEGHIDRMRPCGIE